MKAFKYIVMAGLVLMGVACQKKEFRKVYPNETPALTATVTQTDVIYGSDSINLTVSLKANQTPLSTMEVKVVAGSVLLAKETYRTKDYEYSNSFCFQVPFLSGMEDGDVIVLLTAENVEGNQAVQQLTVKGHVPVFETMFVMPTDPTSSVIGKGKQMELRDGKFVLEGMAWPKKFDFFFAVEGTKFGRVNWKKPVFGIKDKELTLVTEEEYNNGTAKAISIVDETHSNVDTIIFDAKNVAWSYSGPEVKPITKLDVMTDLEEEPASISSSSVRKLYRGAKLFIAQDSEIEISGVMDMAHGLDYDYFEYLGGNKAKFLGKTEMYYVYFSVTNDYVVVEPDYGAAFPDVMWMCGVGMSQPSQAAFTAEGTTSGWGFDSPDQNFVCRTIADNVYQVTCYMRNVDGQQEAHPGFGTVNFKFFHQHGWGGEEAGNNYKMSGDINIIGSTEESNVGNWWASSDPFEGIYRVTLDMNNMTCTYEKVQ